MDRLPRRERDVLELVLAKGEVTAEAVRQALDLSSSAARTLLGRLEAKGLLAHRLDGQRFVYEPTSDALTLRTAAVDRLVDSFFNGSPVRAALALLGRAKPTAAEIAELQKLVELSETRKEDDA